MRVGLFITCFNDTMFPETGVATVRLLERLGHAATRVVHELATHVAAHGPEVAVADVGAFEPGGGEESPDRDALLVGAGVDRSEVRSFLRERLPA